jgi:L-alanine-DL-glutamate epimerase-like enolase superfamily enzyme
MKRRNFLRNSLVSSAGMSIISTKKDDFRSGRYKDLDQALRKPVLNIPDIKIPVILERVELLRYQDNFICRVTSKDGVEGISVSNNMQMVSLYPVFILRIQPFFVGKDARNLEQLLEEVYVYQSNYKLQSLAFWVPLATIEFAILDLLGKINGKSLGALIGTIHHKKIAVYQANNYRGKPAEESLALIKQAVAESGAKAVKFKLGGRMNAPEIPPGRSEKLIPMMRPAFGPDMKIYADANGSYDLEEAIRIGKMLSEHGIDFYEEPVPFDWYEETRQVAKKCKVPIAGGEQEPSMHNFRWLIANEALQIVQPDIFYFGGMIRSMRVARMAAARGKECVPHISGSGLGHIYMAHFVSALPNAGPFHEYKGPSDDIPMTCATSTLQSDEGLITVPTGPGLGITIDPDYVKKHILLGN